MGKRFSMRMPRIHLLPLRMSQKGAAVTHNPRTPFKAAFWADGEQMGPGRGTMLRGKELADASSVLRYCMIV